MKSQQDIILDLLSKGDWICSSQFYAQFIADPRTRLCELRKKGFILESRRCEQHDFHRGGSKEWRLEEVSRETETPKLTIDELALNGQFA